MLAAITLVLLTPAMMSWGGDLAQVFSGEPHPLSVKLQDLETGWSRVKITVYKGGGSVITSIAVPGGL